MSDMDDDDEEDLVPKPAADAVSIKSHRIVLGQAWEDGPRLDETHLAFVRLDFARRKAYVLELRDRMRLKSQPGVEFFPKRPRTLKTLAAKYARSNLHFLPFVKVSLTDAVWDADLVNVSRLLFRRVPPDSRDKDGRLAMSIAIQLKQGAIAKFLLDKRANVNLQDEGTLFTPLHMTLVMGNKSIARRFIEDGARVDVADVDGMQPLHWATIRGFLEVIAMLLEHGADVNAQDNLGMTPLHIACFKGYIDLVDYLLHTAHADLDVQDAQGFSPALYARIEDNGEVLDRIEEFQVELRKRDAKRARRARRRAERLAQRELTESSPHSLI
ncbi:hypothetical protein SDRG_08976 [Saprolegnia diclina VS20]|uniref:Uncharacterized protein n=1 Tax=Saprolegnia diclina (strain VS20) TaxID=1156394 RepID=T0QID8_SAPDV|nr:hypothetical protein SDRG_08976 [Saprolegnia diclina VS20]EQC33465.1 hypothetical protein SDRG_08976 [Saprolegnia diclina VS20]|eukprot:XP_008613105.1 hypothetical protein SDRG_08976 [Saprolegnia diclina VS20]